MKTTLCASLLLLFACEGHIADMPEAPPLQELPMDPVVDPAVDPATQLPPGESMVRRLNAREYRNTVSALFSVATLPDFSLPSDGVNGRNFDTDGTALRLAPQEFERYLDAAEAIAADIARSENAPLSMCQGESGDALQGCLTANVEPFLRRAFRQEPDPNAVAQVLMLSSDATDYVSAAESLIVATLVSPYFLFHYKTPEAVKEELGHIDAYEAADRLAAFLWSSAPDEELLSLAADGSLLEPEVLEAQAQRLLADARSARFARTFAVQWLQLGALGESSVDAEEVALLDDMLEETLRFTARIVAEDMPISRLIDADESILSERLAAHYGVEHPGTPEWALVPLPEERRGLLTQGSLLAARSPTTTTNPFIRGAWTAEHLACVEIDGTVPDNLPTFGETEGDTVRDRVEQHRAIAVCAGCHRHFDHFGLALEEFDALGAYRRTYPDGLEVLSSGVLASGESYSSAAELAVVMGQRHEFEHCVSELVATYALGRVIEGTHAEEFVELVDAQVSDGEELRTSDIVRAIVRSPEFLGTVGDDQ